MRPLIICDIDGVIADCSQRLHYIQEKPANWDGFFEDCDFDAPIVPVIELLRALNVNGFDIGYITGRPKRIREKTVKWFKQHYVPFKEGQLLLMRTDGDHREDWIVKWLLFEEWVEQKRVFAILEDRDQVVKMWRDKGFLCLQPKKGDY